MAKAAAKKKATAKKAKAVEPKRPEGRPSKYSQDLADLICQELAGGRSMRSVCSADSMPCMATVFKWLREIPEFSEQYATAKEEAADAMVDEMLDIVDNEVSQPVMIDGIPLQVDGKLVLMKDAVSVNHARLRADTRKWIASKLKAKKYGDKVTTELTGKDGGAIVTAQITAEMDAKKASEIYKALISGTPKA